MKIEINTKEDSKEEIKHVIKLLMSSLGEDKEIMSNDPESSIKNEQLNLFSSNDEKIKPDNDGYVNIFAPNPETKIEEEKEEENNGEQPKTSFEGFFSNSQIYENNNNQDKEDEEENDNEEVNNNEQRDSFFKEFDDDDKNKTKITFY
jgi:hypothetical protein